MNSNNHYYVIIEVIMIIVRHFSWQRSGWSGCWPTTKVRTRRIFRPIPNFFDFSRQVPSAHSFRSRCLPVIIGKRKRNYIVTSNLGLIFIVDINSF